MDEGTQGFLSLLFISAVGSILAHWKFRGFAMPIGAATIGSVTIFEIFAIVKDRMVDAFTPIAIVGSSVVAAIVSTLIGFVFWWMRGRRRAT